MRWLITIQKPADPDELEKALHACNAELDGDNPPVPLGNSELVVQVTGPADLPDKLKSVPCVVEVYPNSEMQLY